MMHKSTFGLTFKLLLAVVEIQKRDFEIRYPKTLKHYTIELEPSNMNPADHASRGLLESNSKYPDLWFRGLWSGDLSSNDPNEQQQTLMIMMLESRQMQN